MLNQEERVKCKGRIFNYCPSSECRIHQLGSQAETQAPVRVVWDGGIRRAQNIFEMYYLGERSMTYLEHKMGVGINKTRGN